MNIVDSFEIVCKPLAIDANQGDSVVMGVNVASAALALSPVPVKCPVGAVRIGLVDDKVPSNTNNRMS